MAWPGPEPDDQDGPVGGRSGDGVRQGAVEPLAIEFAAGLRRVPLGHRVAAAPRRTGGAGNP
ncbi:hypothetical protein AB0H29_18780 [Streptomyces thermolilacinus]